MLAAGWALLVGRRWGRGLAVFAELLLLPVSYYLTVGSHRAAIGIPVGLVALAGLVLLFSPAALRWVLGGISRAGQLGQLRTGHPVGRPLALRPAADGLVERDRIGIPVQHRPGQPGVAVVHAFFGQRGQQPAGQAETAKVRPHEQVFQVDARDAVPGGEVEEPQRHRGDFAVHLGDVRRAASRAARKALR